MCGVDVETLSKRKCDWIIVQCCIRGRIVRLNRSLGEPCYKLLDISDTLNPGKWGAKGAVVPEHKIKTDEKR